MTSSRGLLEAPLNAAVLSDAQGLLQEAPSGVGKKQGASVAVAAVVLLNTIMGAGILGIPGAYSKCGFVGGTVLLLVSAILASFGVHLLLEASDRSGRPATLYSIAQAAAGPKAGSLIDVQVFAMAFAVSTSYLIVVGDALPAVASHYGVPTATLRVG